MAAVDEVRMALERTVPDFRDRSGDWAGVLEKARTDERKHRRWARWPAAAGAAVAAAAALVLFWPADRAGENVLARARAAVERGPVTHVVVRVASIEVYDLERHEYRSVPDIWEEWFDPARGFHGVQRVGSRLYQEYRGRGPANLPEGAEEFAGIATAYRHALATDNASLGAEETVQGRRVYWIRVAPVLKQYEVAVDAQTFEPRFLRVEGGPVVSLQFETLGAGEGDFTVSPRRSESSSWSGTSGPGPLSPEEAGDALENALWLGERFGKVPLSSIREAEISWSTTKLDPLGESMRALELCYGSGERCAVSLTETTEPYPMAAGGHGWDVRPPPGLLALADEPGLGYVIRNGVYVVLLAPSRVELIAAAEALTPIREQASSRTQKGDVRDAQESN
jgi:hypothetical protein